MNSRTALVLGGGVGGIVAARRLRRRLRPSDRVILVERDATHVFQPSLLWVASGSRSVDGIQRSLDGLRRDGIEVLRGEISALDPARKRVRLGDREIEADAIIASLGAVLAPELVPGLADGGRNLYTTQGAESLRLELESFRGGRVVLLTAAPLYKCPAAPYEAAMLVQDRLRRRGVRADVAMYAAEPGPMATAGPEVSAAVRAMVEQKGIAYHPGHQVTSVNPGERVLEFSNGATTSYDLLIYVPPHRAPDVLREAGLLADNGWASVDAGTMETAFPGVFVIGDSAGIPIPSGKMLPKAGVFAHKQAQVVAENLAAVWSGRTARHRFDGTGACFIETGGGSAGYGSGDFYASPAPRMKLRTPGPWWHWGKVLFEQWWLRTQV